MKGEDIGPVGIAEQIQTGDPRALARAISWVENGDTRVRSLERALQAPAAKARVIGLTGATGAGKSTVTSALVGVFRLTGARRGSTRAVSELLLSGGIGTA